MSTRTPVEHGSLVRQLLFRKDEEGAALILVMLAILIATAMSVLVLGFVLSQVTPTKFDQKNVRALHAAEAGLDVGLGQIRNAQSPDPLNGNQVGGDRTKLPCGTITGRVGGEPGNLTYSVLIRYYSVDPAGKSETWRSNFQLQCTTGSGTPVVPKYALLQSVGAGDGVPQLSATAGNRKLETVYDFRLTNVNVSGGLIHNFNDGNPSTLDLCFDAGSGTPAAGAKLYLRSCVPGSAQQLFSYRSDYSIVLSDTQTAAATSGMCVTADPAPSVTNYLTLQPCDGQLHQEWGFNNGAQFQGQMKGTTNTTPWCITAQSDNLDGTAAIVTTSACGKSYNRDSTWRPDPQVGAGAVGDTSNDVANKPLQWVNYSEFGRCFDITNWDYNRASMIDFPCKQNPTSAVGWNEILVWDNVSGHLYTYVGSSGTPYDQVSQSSSNQYCLQSPVAVGGYVTMKKCASTVALQNWKIYRDVGTYADSYTITDSQGRCLDLGDPNMNDPDNAVHQWSSIIVSRCDGSATQKWNAPPDLVNASTRDTRELPAQ